MGNKHFVFGSEGNRTSLIISGVKILILFFLLLCFAGCSGNYKKQIRDILADKDPDMYTDEQFDKVFNLIENNPRTFEYDFRDKESDFAISDMKFVESDDKEVRVYILERCGFGGNPSWGLNTRTLIQYRIKNNIYTYRMPDTYSVIEKIAKLADNQYLFIAFYGNITQGEHNNHQARVYRLDENGVHQMPRVFERNNHLEDEIVVYWEDKVTTDDESDPESTECYDEDDYEDELYFGIFYNEYHGILYVANTKLIKDDNPCEYTLLDGTFNKYYWDGTCFRDITIMEPYEVKNKDYYIRIEQNKDGSCTYRCWNGGRKVGAPNLTIRGGKRELWDELGFSDYNRWISLDEYSPFGERYTFVNNGYEYQYMTGSGGYEDLEVYNPNGDLIYSKNFQRVDIDL